MYITNIKNTKELKTPHNKSIKWLLPKEIGVPNFEKWLRQHGIDKL